MDTQLSTTRPYFRPTTVSPVGWVATHRSDWMTLHDGLSSILRNYACDIGEKKKMRSERRLTKRWSGQSRSTYR